MDDGGWRMSDGAFHFSLYRIAVPWCLCAFVAFFPPRMFFSNCALHEFLVSCTAIPRNWPRKAEFFPAQFYNSQSFFILPLQPIFAASIESDDEKFTPRICFDLVDVGWMERC
jgi:hypothetical protein